MSNYVKGLISALALGSCAVAFSFPALAAPVPACTDPGVICVSDEYVGGTATGSVSQNTDSSDTARYADSDIADIIGSVSTFSVTGATIQALSDNTMILTVHTNYAGKADSPTAGSPTYGTGYGSLFLGEGPANLNGDNTESGSGDTYLGPTGTASDTDPDRFSHAVHLPTYPGTGDKQGDTEIYKIDTTNPTNQDGTDGFAEVLDSSASGTYRNYQPFTVVEDPLAEVAPGTASYQIVTGDYIQFTIADFFGENGLINDIADENGNWVFAWAMSCANDIIFATVLGEELNVPVPLPGSLILLLSGLLGVGWLGRSRAKAANI